jgi:hypothetical protein
LLAALIRRLLNTVRGPREAQRNAGTGGETTAEQAAGEPSNDAQSALLAVLGGTVASHKHFDYEKIAWVMAAASSAEYMLQQMMDSPNRVERIPLLELALGKCAVNGLVLEFGVYTGKSLRAIARRCSQEVHGFDSFEGLPEDWSYFQKQGRFSLNGKAPQFDEPNIRLHPGYFEQTLPRFLNEHSGPARFIHVDCDLYTSTRTVLQLLAPRIVSGTVILFDEYLNYPGWQQHEYKAFQEFVAQAGIKYRYLGYASAYYAVAVQIV